MMLRWISLVPPPTMPMMEWRSTCSISPATGAPGAWNEWGSDGQKALVVDLVGQLLQRVLTDVIHGIGPCAVLPGGGANQQVSVGTKHAGCLTEHADRVG